MRQNTCASADADRAGGLRPEPAAQSQPKALIPSASAMLKLAASLEKEALHEESLPPSLRAPVIAALALDAAEMLRALSRSDAP